MARRDLDDIPNKTLAVMVHSVEMPDEHGLSERTNATRAIGGYMMLEHLISGDWDSKNSDLTAEFLGRVVANAERQGIAIKAVPEHPLRQNYPNLSDEEFENMLKQGEATNALGEYLRQRVTVLGPSGDEEAEYEFDSGFPFPIAKYASEIAEVVMNSFGSFNPRNKSVTE